MLEAIKKELQEAEEQLATLLKARRDNRERLASTERSIERLSKTGGILEQLRERLAAARALEHDRECTRVVWAVEPKFPTGEYVVTRVTKNRIFTRVIGQSTEYAFYLDGERVGRGGGEIDVEATIPTPFI